jgi:elongation factor G
LYDQAVVARRKLVEQLAEIDDEMMELVLTNEGADLAHFDELKIRTALRRVTLQLKGVPTLVGSSLRNKGVQPVLDAVVEFLPSPDERPPPEATNEEGDPVEIAPDPKGPLVARAFKVRSHFSTTSPIR